MITIANVARRVLPAPALVMVVSGGVWASPPAQEAVQAQVDALANASITSANTNRCENAGKYSATINAILKNAKIDISVFKNNHTQIEQEMQNKMVAILGSIRACEMRASASSSAPHIPAPVQRPPQPAPNYATPSTASSGAGQNGTVAGSWIDAVEAGKRGDWKAAFLLWEPLAKQGDRDAQDHLGFQYKEGKGVPQDYAEAAKWLRKAADQGQSDAQYALGSLYVVGRGVPQDDAEAAKWFHKSADQGVSVAQLSLGLLYGQGKGVPQDDAEAAKWFSSAAAQGNKDAQKDLALLNRAQKEKEARDAAVQQKAAAALQELRKTPFQTSVSGVIQNFLGTCAL